MLIIWENFGTKLFQCLRQQNVLSSVVIKEFHCMLIKIGISVGFD